MTVTDYVRALRSRAQQFALLRTVAWILAGSALMLCLIATRVGLVVGPGLRIGAWIATVAAGLSAGWIALGETGTANGFARWSRRTLAASVSELQSALFFEREQDARTSSDLAAAHAQRVATQLGTRSPAMLLPLRRTLVAPTLTALFAFTFSMLTLGANDTARASLARLIHGMPEGVATDIETALLLDDVQVRVTPPSYMHRTPWSQPWRDNLDVPAGSRLHVMARAHAPLRSLSMTAGETTMRMAGSGIGFAGGMAATQNARIGFRTSRDGVEIQDATPRTLHVVADEAPTIRITDPQQGRVVAENENVVLAFDARDDWGLAKIELIIAVRGRRPARVPAFDGLQSFAAERVTDSARWVPASAGAQPGDIVRVWLEALDVNDTTGPSSGRSETLTFEIRDVGGENDIDARVLQQVQEAALDALADRLSPRLPDGAREANQRLARTHAQLEAILRTCRAPLRDMPAETPAPRQRILITIVDMLNAAEEKEHAVLRSTKRDELAEADAFSTEQLESVILFLDDVQTQQKLSKAQDALDALQDVRAELRERLRDLRENPNEQTRQALRQAMQRAAERMQQLRQELGQMALRVPDAPINQRATETSESGDALQALEQALEQGDLQAAEDAIDALSQSLSDLSSAMEESREGSRGIARGEPSEGEGQGPQSDEGREGGRDDGAGTGHEDHVDIPREQSPSVAAQRRQRVLEALRQEAPDGFEQAARRYLEGWFE